MRKYRSDIREVSFENKENFEKTGMVVWIGSSEYWNNVYLCKIDHRLYIRNLAKNFEALDTFNIRKIEMI